MKSLLLVSLTLLLTGCVSVQTQSSNERVSRSIASDDGGLLTIHGYHSGSDGKMSAEELNYIPEYLQSEYNITGINFKIDTTVQHEQRTYFSFEINRANALKIYDSQMARLRNFHSGTVRTPEQIQEHQRIANCMLANYTVSNFLADFSASDQFNFKFPVSNQVRNINLQTGSVSSQPRCEIWGQHAEAVFAND